MKKRRSKAGETLVETLVSVLIAALAFALLSTTDNGYQYYTDTTSSGVTP